MRRTTGSFHPEITIGDETAQVMCEMVGVIDARALGELVGHLGCDGLRRIEDGLELVLDQR